MCVLPGAVSTKPSRMVGLFSISRLKVQDVSKAGCSESKTAPKSTKNKHERKSVYASVIVYMAEKWTKPRPNNIIAKGYEAFCQC